MAKAAWCTVAPTSGTGNKTIAISASAHTGRSDRATTVTVTTNTGTKVTKTVAVTQSQAGLFITKLSGSFPASIPSAGQSITITGYSNADSLTFGEDSDYMVMTSLKINGVAKTIASGDTTVATYKITEGADTQYTFEAVIAIPANNYAQTRPVNIGITALITGVSGNKSINVESTQAGATGTLAVDKSTLALVAAGAAQNVVVTSNDSWVIS